MRSTDYSDLVDKQMMEAILRSRIEEAGSSEEHKEVEKAVITFSRESWALGDEVLQLLMTMLPATWKYWDKEILNWIAVHAGEKVSDVSRIDDAHDSQISSTMRHLMGIGDMEPLKYKKYLMRAIRVIAKEGKSVIVGRGANLVLPLSLNVRIVSQYENRVQRCVSGSGITEKEARKQISEKDKLRECFIHRIYNRDIHDVNTYDVLFCTDHLAPEQVARSIYELAVQLWESKHLL